MAAEEIFELLDSYWFEHGIFSKKPLSPLRQINPVLDIQNQPQEPICSRLPTLHIRSLSDQALSSKTSLFSDSFSPDSTLWTPKLETILSGKQVLNSSSEDVQQEENLDTVVKPKVVSEIRKRRKKENCKSLSALEFEELKGFMDLGFVFSEEDKDSSLVSILPGLQRLRKLSGENEITHQEEWSNKTIVSRPYLSEAWDALDYQRKIENPLMNWRIPSLRNEVNMKDHLKFWAHTVASTVR
ncbi:uncharacterized protein LOC123222747 [Mangifera indica]|uniref:uncharacterized protein LOC123222747 n=1 Tax=Mangifera indica TaxID=29780 RepID=UPI001CFBABF2|nr:uncharacterized protein LOC123222747 [Mangifera indica]